MMDVEKKEQNQQPVQTTTDEQIQSSVNQKAKEGGKTAQNDGFRYDYDDSSDV
ncbi:hypothetical protein ACFFHM_07890 [Halalkalibacter kiskunsagensis]|uniref:Uncharacterized protein n=2 Tax=Halalkalibacter kiskunsagensis TaxID=1548599 RepID=A0ABV6KAV6_9BACI